MALGLPTLLGLPYDASSSFKRGGLQERGGVCHSTCEIIHFPSYFARSK